MKCVSIFRTTLRNLRTDGELPGTSIANTGNYQRQGGAAEMEERKALPVDWRGAPVSDRLRECAEAQVKHLDRCGKMRRLSIECRRSAPTDVYRVSCRCNDRRRSIIASRAGLALSIEAFRDAQSSHCVDRGEQEPPRASS
jgi:hypothetical protein